MNIREDSGPHTLINQNDVSRHELNFYIMNKEQFKEAVFHRCLQTYSCTMYMICYFGLPGNYDAMSIFRFQIGRRWYHILRRKGQKGLITWKEMGKLMDTWLPFPGARKAASERLNRIQIRSTSSLCQLFQCSCIGNSFIPKEVCRGKELRQQVLQLFNEDSSLGSSTPCFRDFISSFINPLLIFFRFIFREMKRYFGYNL